MKILKLTAENVKKLKAVEITPTGELVEITGRNGAGKTSVLDAIWWALAGTKHIQAVPIRKGATTARIRLDLGELIVERRFTSGGSTLSVSNADGARYPSPQGMLDALLGALTFDPLAFVHQSPQEQFKTLKGLVALSVDPDELDALNRASYLERTEANRVASSFRAQADAITVQEGLPDEFIDTAILLDQMAEAAKVSAAIETMRGERREAESTITGLEEMAKAYRIEATKLRQQADEIETRADMSDQRRAILRKALDQAPPFPEPVDVPSLRLALAAAQATNRNIEEQQARSRLITSARTAEARSRELTETMARREASKVEALAEAVMPVQGLGFGSGVVTFEGRPFEQASTAEQLRVSVAIAMASNPKLRVLRIKEGSLLDQDNVALIATMARDHDYQVWLEAISGHSPAAVIIEDGMVQGQGERDE